MSIEILNMGRYSPNERAINIALPVLAIECEATPPLKNVLDAYEETVLKFVSIGLSADGISHTLNAPKSLIEEILDSLERENFVSKEKGKAWMLTERGQKYISGIVEEHASENSQYGFMFVNAIKKEVLPFFYQGDLNQIPWYIGMPLPRRLTIEGDESKTFTNLPVKKAELRKAYRHYHRTLETAKQYNDGDISLEEATDLFEDLESLDEFNDLIDPNVSEAAHTNKLQGNMFIRQLNCPAKWVYLTMRLIIDPQVPSGYKVESPFDLDGIDNSYFLQQIQWLAATGTTFIEEDPLDDFLTHEIKKLCPEYSMDEKDYSVFLLEKMPLLKICRNNFPNIYEDMARIYSLMQRQSGLIDKENIVNNISRYVVERLLNGFFRGYKRDELRSVTGNALQDLEAYGCWRFTKQLLQQTSLDSTKISWSHKYLAATIGRMESTHGNSIVEKLINLIVLNYYLPTKEAARFLLSKEITDMYELTDRLNQIRRKVSHDTETRFETEDYDFYISHVFELVNALLEANREV